MKSSFISTRHATQQVIPVKVRLGTAFGTAERAFNYWYSAPELEESRKLSIVQEKLVGPYVGPGDVKVGGGCCHRGHNGHVSL